MKRCLFSGGCAARSCVRRDGDATAQSLGGSPGCILVSSRDHPPADRWEDGLFWVRNSTHLRQLHSDLGMLAL